MISPIRVYLSTTYVPIMSLSVCPSTYSLSVYYLCIHLRIIYPSVCPSVYLSTFYWLCFSGEPWLLRISTEGPSQVPAVTGSGFPGTESTRSSRGFVLVWPHLGSAAFPALGPQQALDPDLLRPATLTLRVLPRLHA